MNWTHILRITCAGDRRGSDIAAFTASDSKRRLPLWLALSALVIVSMAFARPSVASIAYVQGKSQNPSSGNPVSATYSAAQNGGDLNVVFVAFNDSTSTVVSVTDSKGNSYVKAVGPFVVSGVATQTVYYAANIAPATAGANTVTVTFSKTVGWPDVRITEYSGMSTSNVFDVGTSASGTGTAENSGSLTTTNANDLLVASDYIANNSAGSDPNFTERYVTSGGEMLEDRIVTSAGAYSASATQSPSGNWLIQVAAFRGVTAITAPSGVNASVVSSNQINLSWTAATDPVGITSYLIERCRGVSCSSFAQIATVSTGTSYSDSNLAASTTYSYRIRATDAAGSLSAYSTPITAATTAGAARVGSVTYSYDAGARLKGATYFDGSTTVYTLDAAGNRTQVNSATPGPLTAPTNVAVTPLSASSLKVTWNAAMGGSGVYTYNVYTGAGSFIATVSTTSYTNISLSASSPYSYTVQAIDSSERTSPQSSVASGNTYPLPTVSFSAAPAATSVTLSWTVSDLPAQGALTYQLLRGSTPIATASPFTDSSLSCGANYTYTLKATDAVSDTATATVSSLTFACPTGTPVPSSIAFTSASITWSGASGIFSSYEYSFTNAAPWTNVGSAITASLSLAPGTQYNVYVHAVNASGAGPSSLPASFPTLPNTPGTPTFKNITQTSATVSWTPASGVVSTYQYSTNSSSGPWTDTNGQVSLSWTGLTPGTPYGLYVRAVNASGPGQATPFASFTTLTNGTPSVPQGITTTPAGITYNQQFTVSWSASVGPVAYYSLNENQNGPGNAPAGNNYTINAPATSWASGVKPNNQFYYYTVKACTSANVCSAYGATATVQTCQTSGCQ